MLTVVGLVMTGAVSAAWASVDPGGTVGPTSRAICAVNCRGAIREAHGRAVVSEVGGTPVSAIVAGTVAVDPCNAARRTKEGVATGGGGGSDLSIECLATGASVGAH